MTGYKHGYCSNRGRDPAYRSWESARARCRNERNPDYQYYGARGISFDHAWDQFVDFLRDMGPRPKGTTLDRINTDGNYTVGNCRWSDARTQAENKRDNHKIEFRGEIVTIAGLSRLTAIPYQRLHERIVRRGWPVDRAVAEPVRGW